MPLFQITDDMLKVFDAHYKNNEESLQYVIFRFKEMGVSQMQTVYFLIDKLNLKLAEADDIVLNSLAWRNNRDANIEFRNSFWDVVKRTSDDEQDNK